jgi:hypothetical protein
MHFTGEELDKLIKSIEKEFGTELALAKSEDEFPPKDKEEKPEHNEEEPKEDHEAPREEHEEAEPEAEERREEAPQAAAPGEAHQEMAPKGHDYDDEDLEHMHKMYMSMSPGEQKAHHDALRKCMDMSMGKSEKEIEEQAPANSPGPKSEASYTPNKELYDAKMKKGENPRRGSGGQQSEQAPNNTPGAKSDASYTKNKTLYKSNKEDGIEEQQPNNTPGAKSDASYTPNKELYDMGKSEDFEMLKSEVEAQKAKNDTLQKTLDGVTEFLTKLATKANVPKGKAVTSYDAIAKSEGVSEGQPMTKSEISTVLAKKAADPSLSKADREAINAFYLNGASLNSISHLLK